MVKAPVLRGPFRGGRSVGSRLFHYFTLISLFFFVQGFITIGLVTRWWTQMLLFGVALVVHHFWVARWPRSGAPVAVALIFASLGYMNIVGTPPEPLCTLDFGGQEEETSVIVGGERVVLQLEDGYIMKAHVSWYTPEGHAVLVGHPVSYSFIPGENYSVLVGGVKVRTVTVLASEDFGLLIAGLPVPDRTPVLLAKARHIHLGPAEVMVAEGVLSVEILGASRSSNQEIKLGTASGALIHGHSGAPVLQDGRLVGVVRGVGWFRGCRWATARLALPMYFEVAEWMERVSESSQLSNPIFPEGYPAA